MKLVTTLEVWPENLPGTYSWDAANEACKALGEGWRLPTKDELNLLYLHKDELGGFGEGWLWSSSQFWSQAWLQRFLDGPQGKYYKSYGCGVRAVRATMEVV